MVGNKRKTINHYSIVLYPPWEVDMMEINLQNKYTMTQIFQPGQTCKIMYPRIMFFISSDRESLIGVN